MVLWIVLLVMMAVAHGNGAPENPASGFRKLGTGYGLGGVLNSIVGPGPSPGSECCYQSYIYADNTFDIVAIDPTTKSHRVFESPVASEWGAWAMAVGPDKNVYIGTLPTAHLFRLNPRTGEYLDLGRPAPTEQYIWQLAVGSDHKLYGCTYPSAKLVRYDPASGKLEDLGRLDPAEQYARFIAASDDGFVYVGIGMGRSHLVAYEIATGGHRDIIPASIEGAGAAEVHRAANGKIFGVETGQHFRLEGWKALPVAAGEDPGPASGNALSDGRTVHTSDGMVSVSAGGGQTAVRFPLGYRGRVLPIFRLAPGPDEMLYASSILPIHFLRVDPGTGLVQNLGGLGGGEFYSLLSHNGRLLMAAYSGKAPLMSYDPGRRFAPGRGVRGNPRLVTFAGQDGAWRPQAMVAGPDGLIYLGAVAGYGKLGGPLAIWNPDSNHVDLHENLVQDQSVVSLAAAGDLIVGGTTIAGGGGSHPTQTEARLFTFDPVTRRKLFEITPGLGDITDLVTVPGGHVFGVAGGRTLFEFDPAERKIVRTSALPFQGVIYNSLAVGPGGKLYGMARSGIFTVNPEDAAVTLLARALEPITAGFALVGHDLYFASGPTFYCYRIAGG